MEAEKQKEIETAVADLVHWRATKENAENLQKAAAIIEEQQFMLSKQQFMIGKILDVVEELKDVLKEQSAC